MQSAILELNKHPTQATHASYNSNNNKLVYLIYGKANYSAVINKHFWKKKVILSSCN